MPRATVEHPEVNPYAAESHVGVTIGTVSNTETQVLTPKHKIRNPLTILATLTMIFAGIVILTTFMRFIK